MRPLSLSLALAALLGGAAFAQQPPAIPPATKKVPPKGVAIPDAERQELTTGAAELRRAIDSIATNDQVSKELRALLPDVEVYWKAVQWPLQYDEFFDAKQGALAKKVLAEGLERAKALAAGQTPWLEVTGPVVRGYRSKIDDSAQPYGVLVPASWKPGDKRARALHVWNHGRGDTLSELAFVGGAMKKVGEFNPDDTFVVAPYGRFCNATKFAGETDVFEAMAAAEKFYPIDRRRIVMGGFSMGGASVWHLGTHHAWRWAAATSGAGFAETAVYAKAFDAKKEPPPWWEQVLWRLYDAPGYVSNISNTRLIAYSGELDGQKQSADLMEEAATREGLKLERIIGPKTGHKYEPEAKKELARRLDEQVAKERPDNPTKVHLVTYTLKYPRQHWIVVEGLEKHWERAEVKAELRDDSTIRVETKNVTRLRFKFDTAPFTKQPAKITIDGDEVRPVGIAYSQSSFIPWIKVDGHWQSVPPPAPQISPRGETPPENDVPLRKKPSLQGPIDDAFTSRFIFVRPTGKALNETVGHWVDSEWNRAVPQWRTIFRGDVRTVSDTAVTDEIIRDSNLILWGDPSSNAVLAKILPQLPVQWTAEKVTIGSASYPAASHVPILIFPNPLNPKKYVVLNSSFTFRQGSDTTNAQQTPKLPDWAIVDLRTPPSAQWPGLVMDAGFFNESWQIPK